MPTLRALKSAAPKPEGPLRREILSIDWQPVTGKHLNVKQRDGGGNNFAHLSCGHIIKRRACIALPRSNKMKCPWCISLSQGFKKRTHNADGTVMIEEWDKATQLPLRRTVPNGA